ncbi:amidase family protein [Sorangium sp. So ce1099]|uniref:amidase family protein n=1 Tax=Sorangium sp. So ce1099 TaxID=3133331 RepID=UPI003F63C882
MPRRSPPNRSPARPAAALAARRKPLELGSEAARSLRAPAHPGGVAGLQPTEGALPTAGQAPAPGQPRSLNHIVACAPRTRDLADVRGPLGLPPGARAKVTGARCAAPAGQRQAIIMVQPVKGLDAASSSERSAWPRQRRCDG